MFLHVLFKRDTLQCFRDKRTERNVSLLFFEPARLFRMFLFEQLFRTRYRVTQDRSRPHIGGFTAMIVGVYHISRRRHDCRETPLCAVQPVSRAS